MIKFCLFSCFRSVKNCYLFLALRSEITNINSLSFKCNADSLIGHLYRWKPESEAVLIEQRWQKEIKDVIVT